MKNGKYQNGGSKRVMVLALALVLLLGCGIGGTIAWLMDTTETVTNTFTVGDINIELKEHDLKADGTLDTAEVSEENTYKILPGTTQPKDPFVRVKANSEDCYVFVQVKEVRNTVSANADVTMYVEWGIGDGWTQLGTTENGISTYYRTTNYATNAADVTYNVLAADNTKGANGYVTYNDKLTKENIEALDTDKADGIETDEMPQLIFKAFAVQAEAATSVSDAWSKIDASAKLTTTSNP